MILGIFLAIGDSFKNMATSGQDSLFKKKYLNFFAENFDKVYVFSYENEKVKDLPKNVKIIPNKFSLHRYLYGFMMPFLNKKYIKKCDVMRIYHLSGTIPGIITKLFFSKSFVFNFAFNYQKFARIERKNIQEFLFKLLEPVALFFSSKVFAANKDILKRLDSKKVVFLPNGVDVNFFKPIKNSKSNIKPVILSVGRLEKQKNYLNLTKAIKALRVDLLIVGKGGLRKQLEMEAKKQEVNLKIIDKVDHTRMPNIYGQVDIFILPSLIEGHPKVLLEAMASGLPVIGTKVEGIREIVKDRENGLLCSISSKSIAKAIKLLLNNKRLKIDIARKARESIKKNYNLNKLFEREVAVLKSVDL